MSYPRFQRARNHVMSRRTSGDISFSTATVAWANVDTGLDLVLAAAVNDVIEVSLSALVGNESPDLYLDCVTIVGGSPVNSFGNAGAVSASPPKYGIASWRCAGSQYCPIGAPHRYTVVSGDISSGNVTLRLRGATSTNTSRSIFAGTNYALQFLARNLGPAAG